MDTTTVIPEGWTPKSKAYPPKDCNYCYLSIDVYMLTASGKTYEGYYHHNADKWYTADGGLRIYDVIAWRAMSIVSEAEIFGS